MNSLDYKNTLETALENKSQTWNCASPQVAVFPFSSAMAPDAVGCIGCPDVVDVEDDENYEIVEAVDDVKERSEDRQVDVAYLAMRGLNIRLDNEEVVSPREEGLAQGQRS